MGGQGGGGHGGGGGGGEVDSLLVCILCVCVCVCVYICVCVCACVCICGSIKSVRALNCFSKNSTTQIKCEHFLLLFLSVDVLFLWLFMLCVLFVCSGDHTETIQLEYNPDVVSYENLLWMFWKGHDPTTRHKPQYMSAIFCHDDEQRCLAKKTRDELQKTIARPVVTVIAKAETFYEAEE